MDVHLFGKLDIEVDQRRLTAQSFGGRKPKQLLEMLLISRGRPVPSDQLASALWTDTMPQDHRATIQHYVSLLRRRLPRCPARGSLVARSHGGYLLDPTQFTLDLDRFDAAVAAADATPTNLRRELLDRALELIGGDVLADEPDAPWAYPVRTHYRRAHQLLLLRAGAAALADEAPDRARELATIAVTQDPHGEPAVCLLVAAHCATGNEGAALEAFDRCRRGLAEVLGVDPMPHTMNLQRSVLRRAPVGEVVAHALRVVQPLTPRGPGYQLRLTPTHSRLPAPQQVPTPIREAV